MRRLLQIISILALALFYVSCGGNDNGTPNPEITGLQPDSGPPGTMVTIKGKGFSPETGNNSVTFGSTSAPVNSASESSIETKVPEGMDSGSAQVKVTVENQTVTGPGFMIESKAPGISSVNPDSGTVGTKVTINGKNFGATASEVAVTFNGTEAPINSVDEGQIKTEVPQGATEGPIKVTASDRETTGPDFDVITEGTLEAIISTSGSDKDSDGYELTIDGSKAVSINVSDSVYVTLEEGTYDVALSDLASNCSVNGSNPRDKGISSGDTTSTSFKVSCPTIARNEITYTSDNEIYLMNADGTNRRQLTNSSTNKNDPALSHSGTRIAFTSDNLYTMSAEGENFQRFDRSTEIRQPSWSPDDSLLVYSDGGDLYTLESDGLGGDQLTSNSYEDNYPHWSYDGKKIIFSSNRDGDEEIYIMNSDGTDLKQLTSDTANNFMPKWSPDDSTIAFVSDRDGNYVIYTMNPDGTNVQAITDSSVNSFDYSWSADGTEIATTVLGRDGSDFEIFKINADGSGTPVNLTNNNVDDMDPSWSPVK